MGQVESFHEEHNRQEAWHAARFHRACSSTCQVEAAPQRFPYSNMSNEAEWRAASSIRQRHGATMRVPRPLLCRSTDSIHRSHRQLSQVGNEDLVSQRVTGVPWFCQGEQQERPLELITSMCGPHEEQRPSVDAEFGLSDWQVAAACRGRQQLCTWYPTTPTSAPRREWADDDFGISDAQLSGLTQDGRRERLVTSLPSCCGDRAKNCRSCANVAVLSDALCPDYSEDEDVRTERLVPVLTPYDEGEQQSYCGYSFV